MNKCILAFLVTTMFLLFGCSDPGFEKSGITENQSRSTTNHPPSYSRILRITQNDSVELRSEKFPVWRNLTSIDSIAVEGGWESCDINLDKKMYLINTKGHIYQSSYSGRWYRIFGVERAKDITSNGTDTYAVNFAGNIFKLNNSMNFFDYYSRVENKEIKRIDVDTNGDLWVITGDSSVYRFTGISAEKMLTADLSYGNVIPQDIGCSQGEIYISTSVYGLGIGYLYKYDINTGSFIGQEVLTLKVDVDDNKAVYIINEEGKLLKKNFLQSSWVPLSEDGEVILDIGA